MPQPVTLMDVLNISCITAIPRDALSLVLPECIMEVISVRLAPAHVKIALVNISVSLVSQDIFSMLDPAEINAQLELSVLMENVFLVGQDVRLAQRELIPVIAAPVDTNI